MTTTTAQPFDFSQTPFTVREDLPQAFQDIWQKLRNPGSWFSAEDRLAVAHEVRCARHCELCAERSLALSPDAIEGTHSSQTNLPAAVVDAVHRITRDASRLSPSYLERFYAAGYSDAHYVELLGIVVAVVSIDAFHDALSLPHEPLPTPEMSAQHQSLPDQYRPPGASDSGAWVPTVSPDALTPPEANIYGGAPTTGNVLSAMSLVPESVRMLIALSNAQYIPASEVPNPNSNGGRAISRPQIELIAGRVSSLNECFY